MILLCHVPLERSQLYMCLGRQQQESRRGCGLIRRSVGRESCKMTRTLPAVFEKGLRDRGSPICALSPVTDGSRHGGAQAVFPWIRSQEQDRCSGMYYMQPEVKRSEFSARHGA